MLDVAHANRISLAVGMGRTRNEELADYYLKAACIGAVWIGIDGAIGAEPVAKIELPRDGRLVYCCLRDNHTTLARLVRRARPPARQLAIADVLEQVAEMQGIGITPHALAVERAHAAVRAVNDAVNAMAASGGLRDFNRAFKGARKVDPSVRYYDLMHTKKAAMLEAMARDTG